MVRQKTFCMIFVCVFVFIVSTIAHAALGDIINSYAAPGWTPRGLAWDGTYLWHADSGTNMIYKLNPSDGSVLASFPTLAVNPWGIGFVGTDLWNYDGFSRGFYSVDPSIGPPWSLEFSKPADDHYGIAYDGTNLWSNDWNHQQINKMDLAGNIISSIPTPTIGSSGIVWDGSNLWINDVFTDTVSQVNPSDGSVLQTFAAPSTQPEGLAFDGTHLWISDADSGLIYEVDAGAFTSTPAPDGTTTLLVMLAGLGGWFGIQRLRFRFGNH